MTHRGWYAVKQNSNSNSNSFFTPFLSSFFHSFFSQDSFTPSFLKPLSHLLLFFFFYSPSPLSHFTSLSSSTTPIPSLSHIRFFHPIIFLNFWNLITTQKFIFQYIKRKIKSNLSVLIEECRCNQKFVSFFLPNRSFNNPVFTLLLSSEYPGMFNIKKNPAR